MSKKKKKQLEKKRVALEKRKERLEKMKRQANPFETKVNKVKHQVVGRKLGSNEVGKPLLSRSRGIQKRNHTLLKEMKTAHKSGRGVIDQRFRDEAGGIEARKALLFKAPEIDDTAPGDDILNVRGRDLLANRRERPEDSDADEDELDLMTRAEYIDSAHFGGGGDGKHAKSREEVLKEMMKEKRMHKREREETLDMTEALDRQFDELRTVLNIPKDNKSAKEKEMQDTYDLLLRNLSKDPRKDDSKSTSSSDKTQDSSSQVKQVSKTEPPKEPSSDKQAPLDRSQTKTDPKKSKQENSTAAKPEVSRYDHLIRQLQVIASYPDASAPGGSYISQTPSRGPDNLFKEKLGELVKESTPAGTLSRFEELREIIPKTTPQTIVFLKNLFKTLKFKKLTLRNFSLILVASEGKQFHPFLLEVLCNFLRQNRHLNSLAAIIQRLLLARLVYKISNSRFVPELVILIRNICCLLSGDRVIMERFLKPSRLLPKLDEEHFFDSLSASASNETLPRDINLFELAFGNETSKVESPMIRFALLRLTLRLLKDTLESYKSLPSFKEIFADHRQLIDELSKTTTHPELLSLMTQIKPMFDEYTPPPPLPPPVDLPFTLPLIEPDFGDWSKLRPSKEKILERKVKKEMRGAVRELRKDSHFIRDQWLKQTLKQDAERKRKTEEIYRDIQAQNSMFKKKRK